MQPAVRRVMTDGRSPLAGHTRHAPRHRRLSTGRGCVGSTRCQLPHTVSKASTSPAHAAPSSLSNNHLPSEIRAGLAPCRLPTRHPTHAGAHPHATRSCEPSHHTHRHTTPLTRPSCPDPTPRGLGASDISSRGFQTTRYPEGFRSVVVIAKRLMRRITRRFKPFHGNAHLSTCGQLSTNCTRRFYSYYIEIINVSAYYRTVTSQRIDRDFPD